jgi:hypothetical protein
MWTARRITTLIVVAILGTTFACSDSAAPLGIGDTVTNDTAGMDVYAPPLPQQQDSGSDGEAAYLPTVDPCAGCTCDPTQSYCFAGSSSAGIVAYDSGIAAGDGATSSGDARAALPLGGFGEPDGAVDAGPPPPPCATLAVGSTPLGCTPLPAACATTPTCACVLAALQPQFSSCYLVCTPSPGHIEVYCGG